MHKDELWQEFDKNANRLGGINPENYDPEKVQLFGGVAIMLYRFHNEKVEFLFQKRSKFVDRNADKWDVSAGGHINFKEDKLAAAKREAEEEIGAELEIENLEYAATYVRLSKNFVSLFFYDWTGKPDNFHFNDEEVSGVKWVAFDDLVDFWDNLKPGVNSDQFFQCSLLEWTKQARKKHEHLDK